MKRVIIYVSLLLIVTGGSISCKKMDSTYKQFVIPGGITYTGKVTSPVVYAGRNRIKIAWLRGTDPNVTRAKITWNNNQDSVIVSIPATGDTISVIINNLDEKRYSFIATTYDDKGHSSVPVELLGESFGTKYESLLVTRPPSRSETDQDGILNITWANANVSGGAYATEMRYTATDGQVKVKRILATETLSAINDYKPGTTYEHRTLYVPTGISLDTFYTAYRTEHVAFKIPKAGLAVTTDSYAKTSQLPKGGPPQFAFDDDISTFWHTHHTPAPVPGFPHWLAVDLAKTYRITRVELTCRPGVTNTFTEFTIQGSMDGTNWSGYNSFTLIQKDPTQSFTLSDIPLMRHIRIYATKGPNAYANLAEFTVYGYEE
ncbi:hypothetical protein FW774_15060 [Pedobacter sp. BS3]|uniref:DUF4998 domain-containing protein n=1 Tax=Pedobacter sp. BS3 TaxID=2567937 RepID=UPI0011ED3ADB|nr:DUF4998 domain-containing protein [Pedobacter sp. BS3]TZF82806.1 hypothetical protein FW774_15060 [Pedobacter sp. BS3]